MADKADSSVVMAQLQIAFLSECDNKGLTPYGRQFSCLPNLIADCGQGVNRGFSSCLD